MDAGTGLLVYASFQYSTVEVRVEFNPRLGSRFWSNGYQYGNVMVIGGGAHVAVELYPANGPIELKQLCCMAMEGRCSLMGAHFLTAKPSPSL